MPLPQNKDDELQKRTTIISSYTVDTSEDDGDYDGDGWRAQDNCEIARIVQAVGVITSRSTKTLAIPIGLIIIRDEEFKQIRGN